MIIIALSFVWARVKNGYQQKGNTPYFTVFFDNGKNASQAVENVNSVYDPDTVTANHAQLWFRRFRFCNFNVKDESRTGIVKNVDKTIEIVESDHHVSTVSTA